MEGIGKLLNYLKKYAPDYCKELPDDIIMDEIVISKKFGFIKRLVDNDKIDMETLGKLGMYGDLEQCRINTYNALLMLLAISDTPIDLLCSVLK